MNSDLRSNCWPIQRIGEALEAVARRSGLSPRPVESVRAPAWLSDAMQETLKEWVDVAAASLDIEALPSQFPYCDAESFVENCGPAIVRVEFGEPENDTRLLLILRQKWRGLEILCPDLTTRIVKASQIRDLLCQPLEEPLVADVERLLDEAQIAGRRRARVGSSILRERLSVTPIDAGWLLRLRPSRRFSEQVSEARIRRRLFAFVTAHTAEYLLALFSWWIIGRGALEGRLDYGWLLAWILLLATRIPFRLAATWFQGLVAISGGALVKRRLLAGALKLRPEEMRTEGVGHLLGRVIESEALESLALNGALTGIVSVIEIVIAAAILLLAAESLPLSLLLLAWTVVLGALTWRYMRRRDHWTSKRLEITNELVERMAGRRTRLAQEPREKWHESEDEMLERYVEDCRRMDRSLIPLSAIVREDGRSRP
jgi:ATP-binding cassette, subfamily B, bacterial